MQYILDCVTLLLNVVLCFCSLLLFIIWEISCSFHPHGKTNLVDHSSSDFKSFNCVFTDFTTEFYLRMLHYFADNLAVVFLQ